MPQLKDALAAQVEGRTLVIAGYSFSDHFDLVPLIENEWRPSRIIWIEYQTGAGGAVSALEAVEESIMPDAALPFPVGALARAALDVADGADFSRGAALAEQAAYCAWRSGRWDLGKRAVNEFTWYLTMAGKARSSVERLRAVCPEDDRSGWVALTANIALTAALYVAPKRARVEISSMEQRVDEDDKDLWLHVLVCQAACELAEGGREAGLKSLEHAQQIIDALGTDVWGHQTCIDAIKQRLSSVRLVCSPVAIAHRRPARPARWSVPRSQRSAARGVHSSMPGQSRARLDRRREAQ